MSSTNAAWFQADGEKVKVVGSGKSSDVGIVESKSNNVSRSIEESGSDEQFSCSASKPELVSVGDVVADGELFPTTLFFKRVFQ